MKRGVPFRLGPLVLSVLAMGALAAAGAARPQANWRQQWSTEPVISIFLDDQGYAINLPMEEYLAGVVAAEMDPEWPVEALTAQAIVSRTLTLKDMELGEGPRKIHNTDACTSPEHLQAYGPQRVNANVRAAVAASRGQVLTYDRDLIFAMYANSAGGLTATGREAFPALEGPAPYLPSVPSLGDGVIPPAEEVWKLVVPRWELEGVTGVPVGSSSSLTVTYGPSGRVVQLKLGGKTIAGADLRMALGPDRFRSTLITSIEQATGSVVFTGRGWGHGSGLDQRGAQALATAGWRTPAIIGHYFQGVSIERLWK
ncbi:MAG: SpoIID/LytB domain-containing protein [Bacillota bacterium]